MGGNVALKILERFGFSSQFCVWIEAIFKSTYTSILFNGSPQGYFSFSHEVRQSVPLSPIFFSIAEDFLSRYLSSLVASGSLLPMLSPQGGQSPTHLIYADDVLFFSRGTVPNLQVIVNVFYLYGYFSCQLVNKEKSNMFFG